MRKRHFEPVGIREIPSKEEPPEGFTLDEILHPRGRCKCAGEGTCDWCLECLAEDATREMGLDPEVYDGDK